jgi:hypothetical protein
MSIVRYVTYEVDTGRVVRNSSASAPAYANLPATSPDGFARYVGDLGGKSSTRYIIDGHPTDRPAFNVTVTGSIVTGLPSGTSVIVLHNMEVIQAEVVTDGEVDLTGSSTGTYQLKLTNFPYKDEEIIITL